MATPEELDVFQQSINARNAKALNQLVTDLTLRVEVLETALVASTSKYQSLYVEVVQIKNMLIANSVSNRGSGPTS